MKFAFSLIGLVAVVMLFAGCLGGDGGGAAVKDCGEDMMCYGEAYLACSPAKVTMPGPGTGATIYIEIKGGSTEQCSVYYAVTGGDLDGKSMTCTLDTTDMTNVFDCAGMSDICTGSWVDEACG